MAAIDDAIREHVALAKQRDAQFSTAVVAAPVVGFSLVRSFQIGQPVLDLITGQQGVVIDGKRENVLIPATVSNGS